MCDKYFCSMSEWRMIRAYKRQAIKQHTFAAIHPGGNGSILMTGSLILICIAVNTSASGWKQRRLVLKTRCYKPFPGNCFSSNNNGNGSSVSVGVGVVVITANVCKQLWWLSFTKSIGGARFYSH